MRRLTKIAAVTAVMALAVTGCAKKDTETNIGQRRSDKGGLCAAGGQRPQDRSRLRHRRAWRQVVQRPGRRRHQEGRRRRSTRTCKESEAAPDEPDSAKEERLRTLADAGYDPIVAVGFVYTPMVTKVAKEYPKLKFAIVDGAAKGDNVTNLAFSPEQGSFLVGVAAGLKTKTNKVGFVGGVKGPIIDPFAAGYQAGVKAVNPKATVEMKWLSDQADQKAFANPPGGKTAAHGALRRRRRHRLPRLRPVRQRCLRGGRGRRASWPSAWTPTSTSPRPRTSSRTS